MIDVSLLIAAVVGITEAAKRSGMPSKWAPLLSIALGVGASLAFNEGDMAKLVVDGIILGLSSAGLYSGTKAVVTK